MDEILILDAIERHHRGEMSESEEQFFEEMRKNNPEVDQLAVEHGFFLQELDKYSTAKAFRQSLHETEVKLAEEGLLAKPVLKGRAKLVQMWKKYKRTVAVAASIAGVISVVSAGLIIGYSSKYVDKDDYKVLVGKINEIEKIKDTTKHIPQNLGPDGATAFLLDNRGYFVTNYHVTDKFKNNIYVKNNKGEYFAGVTIYRDMASDVSVIRIADTSVKFPGIIPYSIKKNTADLGERLFTLGYPRNEIVYSEGYLSAKSGFKDDSTAYQVNISANEGNSGSPVLNNDGELVGIITGKKTNADGFTYSAKAKVLYDIIDDLKKSDTLYKNIRIPTGNGLKGLDRTKQIKKLEDYVYMVVGN